MSRCRRVRCAHVGCVRVRRLCGLPSGVGGVHEACWFPRCVGPRPVGWLCLVWGSWRVGRWHDGGHPPVVCLSALCACACVCRTRTCCMWCAAVCCMWCVRALSLERVPGWGEGHAMDVRPADCRERCVRVMQRMLCYVSYSTDRVATRGCGQLTQLHPQRRGARRGARGQARRGQAHAPPHRQEQERQQARPHRQRGPRYRARLPRLRAAASPPLPPLHAAASPPLRDRAPQLPPARCASPDRVLCYVMFLI